MTFMPRTTKPCNHVTIISEPIHPLLHTLTNHGVAFGAAPGTFFTQPGGAYYMHIRGISGVEVGRDWVD